MVQVNIGIDGTEVNTRIGAAKSEINEALALKADSSTVSRIANELTGCAEAVQTIKQANYVSQGTLVTLKAAIDNSVQGVQDSVMAEIQRQADHVQTIIGWADESETVLDRLNNLGNIANSAVQTAQNAAQGQIDAETVRSTVQSQLQGLDVVTKNELQGAVRTEVDSRGFATVQDITDPEGTILQGIVTKITPGVTTSVQENVQGYVDLTRKYALQASTSVTQIQGMDIVTKMELQGAVRTEVDSRGFATEESVQAVQSLSEGIRSDVNIQVERVQSALQIAAEAKISAQSAFETAKNAAQGQIDAETVRSTVQSQLQGLDVVTKNELQGAVRTEVDSRGFATVQDITDPEGTILQGIVTKITPGVTTSVQENVQGYVDLTRRYATQSADAYDSIKIVQGTVQGYMTDAVSARAAAEVAQGIAQGSSEAARNYATQAYTSASGISRTEENVEAICETVGAMQGTVQGYVTISTNYATQAATSSKDASTQAVSAINAANNALSAQGIAQGYANTARSWAVQSHDDYIAMGASINDGIVQGVVKAHDSLIQEVGDMIEDAMENTADLIDLDGLAIPVEQAEDSSNKSFNDLVSLFTEKPVRKSDVLNKVIDEDVYYWYVMPVIDQRIYKDTVIDVDGQQVTVEYGWQKAVKERYWYHKQDSDIRDHYIYLFRSEINNLVAKTSEKNSVVDDQSNVITLAGDSRKKRSYGEIPANTCVVGGGNAHPTHQRHMSPFGNVRDGAVVGGLVSMPISSKLTAKATKTIPATFETAFSMNTNNGFIIDGDGRDTTYDHTTPYVTSDDWQSVTNKKEPHDDDYPADFYYLGCYAECDDSAMYEHWMYTSATIADIIVADNNLDGVVLPTRCVDRNGNPESGMIRLSKRDDGSWYFTVNDTEYTVESEYRAEYFEMLYNGEPTAFAKLGSVLQSGDAYLLQRRPFADVSRDIKVHALPIYILGSTAIAIDSDNVDGDGKYNWVTIDSMITPKSGDNASSVDVARNTISLVTGELFDFVCRDNVSMVESGLPCVYGQGYTWLPLDAKGDADDEGGLGVNNTYKQDYMWNVAGIYASYNGLIPSGYTKTSLKAMAMMYKYKIVEKFMLGQWSTVDGKKQWVPTSGEDEVDIPIFVADYSNDGLADLNEDIFDINIDDRFITYTIKNEYVIKQETGGNAGTTHSDFITNTIAYLTEDGTVNTNNVFLICVEDDGDEYIFDEYIIEKGKVLKLNEQKRLKYSKELRKIHYEVNFGLANKSYNNTLIPGTTDTEQANAIMDYLYTEELVDSGLTIPNPDYIPEVPESINMSGILGGRSYNIGCDDHTKYESFMTSIMKTGIIEAIAFSFKYKLLKWNSSTLISSGIDASVLGSIAPIWNAIYTDTSKLSSDVNWLKTKFIDGVLRCTTGPCSSYWVFANTNGGSDMLIQIADYLGVTSDDITTKIDTTYRNFTDLNGRPGSERWCLIDMVVALMVYNLMKESSWDSTLASGIMDFINNTMDTETASSIETITRRINTAYNGIWCANYDYGTYRDCKVTYTSAVPVVGSATIPIYENKLVARQTMGASDNLQRYNKILAFLIAQNAIVDNSGVYEWIYACYRYMPTSNTYINVGNRSFKSTTKPDVYTLNDISTDNVSNTSITEQVNRQVESTKQDMLARMAEYDSEEALLNHMPRLKAIIEQCFATETIQGTTTYKIAGVPSVDNFNQLVSRVNKSEANMVNMATVVNQGKRIKMENGIIGADTEDIFSGATVNPNTLPVQDQEAAMDTESIITPNIDIQTTMNKSRSYTTTTKTIQGVPQTVLMKATRL